VGLRRSALLGKKIYPKKFPAKKFLTTENHGWVPKKSTMMVW
jgi:hypothetical protein